jgi:DNA processing protein
LPQDEPPPAELRDHLALALVPGLGPKLTRAVLDHFGSAAAVLKATVGQLESVPLIGFKLAQKFHASFATVKVGEEWDRLQRFSVAVALWGGAGYPQRLMTIDDAPPLLYSRGSLIPADDNAVALVGSRQCTPYGRRMAERLASGLARAGYTVVSGLARGIDGAAHKAALDAGGRTVAVLAGGLSAIYPPEHTDLAEAVAANGALLTETPMTVAPQPGMFPARNRIISALSRGIVVVEANVRSGALITATHAAEQGREVFVVPGNADSAASAGCLELIRKGARLIRSVDDILEDLQGVSPPDVPVPVRKPQPVSLFDAEPNIPPPHESASEPPPGLDELQRKVWDILAEPRQADELARELERPMGELATILMKLEMKKVIRRMPGNVYSRR